MCTLGETRILFAAHPFRGKPYRRGSLRVVAFCFPEGVGIGIEVVVDARRSKINKREAKAVLREFRSLPDSPELNLFPGLPPRGLGELVGSALKELRVNAEGSPEAVIAANWGRVVGKTFASKCAPDRLTEDGCLLVQVAGSAVKQELTFRKRGILDALRRLPDCHHVREVRFLRA